MGKLILLSRGLNTRVGRELIKKCLKEDDLKDKTILLVNLSHYEVGELLIWACEDMGFLRENIYLSDNFNTDSVYADYIYVTEGNTFEILDYMKKHEGNLMEYIKECVKRGAVYIGASAGAIIASSDISMAKDFDMNFVRIYDYDALGLFKGAIVPHYEHDQLMRYLSEVPHEMISDYPIIYSVANDEALILDGDSVDRIRVK